MLRQTPKYRLPADVTSRTRRQILIGSAGLCHSTLSRGVPPMTMKYQLLGCAVLAAWALPAISAQQGGYVLERDSQVAKQEPGTHNGGGQTIGYSFFSK